MASGTMYPTQSTILTFMTALSPRSISTASSGTNLGSVVMTVLPAADWGISSRARARSFSSRMFGITAASMNFLMNVDLPVRTGPMTPR